MIDHIFSWFCLFSLWYLIWLFKYLLFKFFIFYFYSAQKSNLLCYELRAIVFSGWFKEGMLIHGQEDLELLGGPCWALPWTAITQRQWHQPSISVWTPDNEIWLTLVVGFWAGEERAGDRGKEERSCSLSTTSKPSEHCLELEGMPTCHVGNHLEGQRNMGFGIRPRIKSWLCHIFAVTLGKTLCLPETQSAYT